MTWLAGVRREPLRSRLLIVIGWLVAIAEVVSEAVGDRNGSRSWTLLGRGGSLLSMLVVLAWLAASMANLRRPGVNRPARLIAVAGRLQIPPLQPPGILPAALMVITGGSVANQIHQWRSWGAAGADDPLSRLLTIVGAVLVASMVLLVPLLTVLAWFSSGASLTPAGIEWRTAMFRRLVPWAALAPEGPPRPALGTDRLELLVHRPDLVTERGWARLAGRRERPVLSLAVDVHPWYLADTIRWYVDHPDDRAAIGSPGSGPPSPKM